MPQLEIFNIEKGKVGTFDLDPAIFEAPVKKHLMHAVVNWQLAKKGRNRVHQNEGRGQRRRQKAVEAEAPGQGASGKHQGRSVAPRCDNLRAEAEGLVFFHQQKDQEAGFDKRAFL